MTYTKEQDDQVTADKGSQDAQLPPPMAVVHAQRDIELVAHTIRTVLTA